MIPSYQNRDIQTDGVTDTMSFGISLDDSAHIMTILRDTLYSDKVLAVLREYSANAWDSHREAGKKDLPIKVVLPTKAEPTLIIQDFGVGLSHESVFSVYTQYGKSTKRGSNEAVGQLGIGSKSGFAYSDTFTIVACHGGIRRTYVALLDESEKGTINLLLQEPCGDKTGVAIHIPVLPEDIEEFHKKAANLFRFFNPRPDINITLPPEPAIERRLNNGILYSTKQSRGEWLALMGCIPYKVDLDQLKQIAKVSYSESSDDKIARDRSGLGGWIHQMSGVLYFGIGEVHISASREELKYSKSTKQNLVDKLNGLVDEFVTEALTAIESETISNWEKRLRLLMLAELDMPMPDGYKGLAKGTIRIGAADSLYDGTGCKTFELVHPGGSWVRHLEVCSSTRLLLHDDTRKMEGFYLNHGSYLVRRKQLSPPDNLNPLGTYPSWDDAKIELADWLIGIKADGIPIGLLSNETWTPPYKKPKKLRAEPNAKHHQKHFLLKPDFKNRSPYSDAWDAVPANRVPTADDVFVILNGFKTDYDDTITKLNIYNSYMMDEKTLKYCGMTMPPIYAYKTTKKMVVKPADCTGVFYPDWRKKVLDEIALRPDIQKDLVLYDWHRNYQKNYHFHQPDTKRVFDSLGKDHPLTQYLIRTQRAFKKYNKYKYEKTQMIERFYKRVYKEGSKPETELVQEELFKRYPLLGLTEVGVTVLWKKNYLQWCEYVQLIDKAQPLNLITFTAPAVGDDKEDDDDE